MDCESMERLHPAPSVPISREEWVKVAEGDLIDDLQSDYKTTRREIQVS